MVKSGGSFCKLAIAVLLLSIAIPSQAQYFQGVRGLRDGVYAEAYLTSKEFSTGFVSVNFERFFGNKYRNSIRVGVLPDFRSTISFPITWSYITRPYDRHHFEIGIGLISQFDFFEGLIYHDIVSAIIPVMYRYTNAGRFYFRGGLNIFYSWPILPTASVSLGYRF